MSRLARGPRNRANSPAQRVAFSALLGGFVAATLAVASAAAGAPTAALPQLAAAGPPLAAATPAATDWVHDKPVEPLSTGTAASQPRAQSTLAGRHAVAARAARVFVGPPPEPLDRGSGPARQTTPAPTGAEAVGQAALERISYPWQSRLPGWRIRFVSGQGQLHGLTIDDEQRIEIYVHSENVETVARVLAHEFGHAVDIVHNNTARRRQWEAARGIGDAVAWWPAAGLADFSTGAGDFAECFATWQLGSVSRSAFGACSSTDLDLMAQLAHG